MADIPSSPDRICVGVIVGAHGIQGGVKVKSFTADPADLDAYGPLTDEGGSHTYELLVMGQGRGVVLCRVEGVIDRNAAEALKGTRLYLDRAALPALDDAEEFYHSDLLGLRVDLTNGTTLGTVAAVFDFGAGDVLEVKRPEGGSVMLPFTRAAVPVIDLPGGRLVAESLPGLLDEPKDKPEKARPRAAGAAVNDDGPDEDQEWPEEDWR